MNYHRYANFALLKESLRLGGICDYQPPRGLERPAPINPDILRRLLDAKAQIVDQAQSDKSRGSPWEPDDFKDTLNAAFETIICEVEHDRRARRARRAEAAA